MEAPMRIILFLVAAVGAAVAGAPALAQSSAAASVQRGAPHPASSRSLVSLSRRAYPGFRPGMTDGSGHHRDGHRGRYRFDRGAGDFIYPYGFAGSSDIVDPHGNGFFAGSGGEIR